jgi:hypothetical protein
VSEVVHVMRESSTRPNAFRLICGESPRRADAWVLEPLSAPHEATEDMVEVNCPRCNAILAREAKAKEGFWW